MVPRVLVTGGNGFIGSRLLAELQTAGAIVRCAVRSSGSLLPGIPELLTIDSIGPTTNWESAVKGIDVVIHIAGVANAETPVLFDLVNGQGTRVLAEAAAAAGVKRFVFLSTIGVNGDKSNSRPFREEDEPNPVSRYAKSKLAAEIFLRNIADKSKMEWCIVRAPMVYGLGAPGKFSRLVEMVRRQVPLPLRGAVAMKSFISVENLSSLLTHLSFHPNAFNSLWLASDAEDISTVDFVRSIGKALGRPPRLFYVPERILHVVASLVRREEEIESLFNALQIDSSHVHERLTWTPPLRLTDGIARAVGGAEMAAATLRLAG